jgi:hypothetical protein
MARAKRAVTVLKVEGPVVLDWGNGVRIQLSPAGAMGAPAPIASVPPRKGAGRPPSAATLALRQAMAKDAHGGHPRTRADYLGVLKGAGGPPSPNAAGIIVNREAKRAFGRPLGRGKGASKGVRKGARRGGRQAFPATAALRTKLTEDAAKGDLRDAPYYVRWVVDQPGVKMGLKQARPIVYRELRAART